MHVVFIHGMSCTGALWAGWSKIFRDQGFVTHQPSLPFHEPPDPAYVARLRNIDNLNWLADFLDSLPEPAVLVGHSNGELLALKLTEMGKSRATLILNAIGPRGTWVLYPGLLPHALPHFLQWGFWRKPVVLKRWQADHLIFNRLDKAEADLAFAALVPESGMVATEAVFSPMLGQLSLAVDPSRIDVPMRSIVGLDDNLVAPRVGRAIKRRFGAKLDHIEAPGRGHWLPWERNWEELAAESGRWLQWAAAR